MQKLTVIEAKINPGYWQLISEGKKTIEVRDEKTGDRGSIFRFINPDTGKLLGYAQIEAVCTIRPGWTIPMIAQLASISMPDALALFDQRADGQGIGMQSLYAYQISPTDRLD